MNKKEKIAFLNGMECSLEWVRKDIGGSALRIFDMHTYFIFDYVKQVKKLINKK